MAAKTKKESGTLESLVRGEKGVRPADKRVYFLSEVAWDSHYFEESERQHQTYQTALQFMADDPELTGVIVDGAVSRLDRPEFLNDALTFWNKTQKECEDATKEVLNRQQYAHMAQEQFKILDQRLAELREQLPNAKLALNVYNDDVQYTATQLIHELLVSAGGAKDQIDQLKGGRAALIARRHQLKNEYKLIENEPGKRRERDNLRKKLQRNDRKLAVMADDEATHGEQVALFTRPKKVRPIHQWTQAEVVREMYAQYTAICAKHDVELLTKETVLDFDGFRIEYNHSREFRWTPMKSRHRRFVDGTHGRAADFEGVDALVESGHHGQGQKTLQRLELSEPEINFLQWGDYNGEVGTKTTTLFSAPPFEDQAELRKFARGEKPERLGAGKGENSRSHPAMKRLENGGVAGLGILRKDADGLVHAEMIQMADFIDRSVLNQPDVYNFVGWTSDEHIGAKESLPILREGVLALYKLLINDNPVRVRGKPIRMVGFGSGGDTAENNCGNWPDKAHSVREPYELIREDMAMLAKVATLKPSERTDWVYQLALRFASDAASGSVQSMRAIKDQLAEYYGRFLELTLEHSPLKQAHSSTPGNHGDSKLRSMAEKETDHFVRDCKAKGYSVYEVGVKHPPEDARVFIGGGDYAHVLFMKDYGASIDGEPLFGPVRTQVQHDPVDGEKGLDGAGASISADLTIAGHTHEHYVKMVSAGDNRARFSYRLATINGVDPTQIRYASSVPRTQAAHAFTMPKAGHLIEFTFPAHVLKALGEAQLYQEAQLAVGNLK